MIMIYLSLIFSAVLVGMCVHTAYQWALGREVRVTRSERAYYALSFLILLCYLLKSALQDLLVILESVA